MKFAIQINNSPYYSQSGTTAYQFIKAALALGHQIERVFFYHDGIYHGIAGMRPPQDEQHPGRRWSALEKDYGLDLVICISAAQRRGLTDSNDGLGASVAEGFRISGLGQWVDACIKADRTIIF